MWAVLEKIFTDNKRLKTVELIGELRMLDIGDLTVDAYFRKIDSLALRLDNLGKSALSSSSRISSSSPTALVAQPSSACNHGSDIAYLLIYVDDIILTASSATLLQRIITSLHSEFSMTDLGPLHYFLGISVSRDATVDTESKLGTDGPLVSDPTLYRSIAGALQYLTFTRPDLSYAVQQICLFMHDPREPYRTALKMILLYVRGTFDYGLQLFSASPLSLIGYSDANWAGCPTTHRSTSGYFVFLGNNLLSWSSKRQATLSRSTAEAEYRSVANVVAETAWLRNLLRGLHSPLQRATLVYYDNVRHVRVLHVPSRYQFADIFTKGLPYVFDDFRSSLSVRPSPALTAGGCGSERLGPSSFAVPLSSCSITDIKSTVTLKALKNFCEAYHIPDEVHPQIPTPNQTTTPIHEMHMLVLIRRYIQVLRFSQDNAVHLATSLLLLLQMDLFAFICTADPTKVRIGEKQRGEDEPKLLDTTVGAQSELDASVDRLFDEEGGGNEEEHHDSDDGGQGAGTLIVSEATEVVAEDVIPLRSRQRKRKTIVDADELSHPARKLRDDHGAPGGPFVAGKSRSAVQRLLARAVLNAEVRGEPIPTLPFVTSSVSATPEREDEHPADSVTGLNLQTICASQRFVISSDSSHHSGTNIAEAEVDYIAWSSAPIIATIVTATAEVATTTKEAPAKPSLFAAGLSSAGGTDPVPGGFSDVSGSDFLVGDIRTVVDPEFDLQKVYVPQWSVTNGSPRQISLSAEVRMRAEYNIKEKRRLKAVVEEKDILLKTKGEEIDSLNAQLLLKEAESAEAIHLRVEASRFGIVKKSLQDEVKLLKEHNAALEEQKGVLDVKVADLAATVKVREQEAADSDALVTTVKLQNDSLADQVRELEASSVGLQEKVTTYEKFVDQLEKFQDDKIKEVNDKLEKLDADVVAMYLSAIGAAIGKAVEKGMQEGLSADITHGIEGRTLTDIAAYNPSVEADYLAALHHLKSDRLADRLGLTVSQPRAYQLMVPIHHSPDHRVIGASALSLSLDVSNFRVRKIKENLANRVSALRDVFIPLSEPLSVTDLTGTEGTSAVVAIPAGTTTALSVTFASTSVVRPISTDDYEIVHVDGQRGGSAEDQIGGDNVDPFPNVDNVDLNLQ
ncbi:gypsy type transposase [Tanacetum coccineum]|uniref:Gypsy type transposase n=1 Tax=Tanacetum coccineum TaxID=301880 RepID=A0ABQ5D7N4_9ASTR